MQEEISIHSEEKPSKKEPGDMLAHMKSIDPSAKKADGFVLKGWMCFACGVKMSGRCRCKSPDFCADCNTKFGDITKLLHNGTLRYNGA